MIATRKDIIFIGFMTLMTFVALVYGFATIPSPFEQQKLTRDHTRVVDLAHIKNALGAFYSNNNSFPTTLDPLMAPDYSYGNIKKNDPQNQPYTYTLINPTTYKVCATFETDNQTMTAEKDYDSNNYDYKTYRDALKHPQGNYCFATDDNYDYGPTPTLTCLCTCPTGGAGGGYNSDKPVDLPATISPSTSISPTVSLTPEKQ